MARVALGAYVLLVTAAAIVAAAAAPGSAESVLLGAVVLILGPAVAYDAVRRINGHG
jgi:hypothetical protein